MTQMALKRYLARKLRRDGWPPYEIREEVNARVESLEGYI